MKRKNIVFIMADQLAASFIGCYGSGVPSTPCLDALAAEGMRFDRSYAAAPVCAPNRACILTGRSNCVNGMNDNNYVLPNTSPTYVELLRQNGYTTGGFGKFHSTPMMWPVPAKLSYLGFDESVISDDVKWGPYMDWVRREHPEAYETALATANEHSGPVIPLRQVDLRQGATEKQASVRDHVFYEKVEPRRQASFWKRSYPSPIPADAHDSVFITELGLDFLSRHAKDRQPFFCHVSYVDPHDPYDPPAPYDTMFHWEDMPEPAPQEWCGVPYLEGIRDNYLHFRDICEDKRKVRQLRAMYHGSVRLLDEQIGRIVRRLKELGLWEDTIVVFATDHGDLMGDHGLIAKGEAHYDACIRTPLIVAGGGYPRGVNHRLTTSLDLYPTFCGWAGIGTLPPLEGRRLEEDGWGEILVHLGGSNTVITQDGWRLTMHSAGDRCDGQLFYLKEDPAEQNNRYGNPRDAGKQAELSEKLVQVLARPWKVQYQNLPVRHGEAYTNINRENAPRIPALRLPENPWTADTEKPEWHGRD